MPRASIEELEEALAIDRNALDDAIHQQPELYYEVTKQLALLMSRVDRAKQEQKEIEAKIDKKIRHLAEVHDEKVREGDITSQITLDPEAKQGRDKLLKLELEHATLEALKWSFVQRNDALERLLRIYMAERFSGSSMERTQREMNQAEGERIRQRRANARAHR